MSTPNRVDLSQYKIAMMDTRITMVVNIKRIEILCLNVARIRNTMEAAISPANDALLEVLYIIKIMKMQLNRAKKRHFPVYKEATQINKGIISAPAAAAALYSNLGFEVIQPLP